MRPNPIVHCTIRDFTLEAAVIPIISAARDVHCLAVKEHHDLVHAAYCRGGKSMPIVTDS